MHNIVHLLLLNNKFKKKKKCYNRFVRSDVNTSTTEKNNFYWPTKFT